MLYFTRTINYIDTSRIGGYPLREWFDDCFVETDDGRVATIFDLSDNLGKQVTVFTKTINGNFVNFYILLGFSVLDEWCEDIRYLFGYL